MIEGVGIADGGAESSSGGVGEVKLRRKGRRGIGRRISGYDCLEESSGEGGDGDAGSGEEPILRLPRCSSRKLGRFGLVVVGGKLVVVSDGAIVFSKNVGLESREGRKRSTWFETTQLEQCLGVPNNQREENSDLRESVGCAPRQHENE